MGSLNRLAGAAVLSLAVTSSDAQEVTRNNNLELTDITPVSYEIPATVQAALDEYRTCLEEAAAVTAPEIIPEKDLRELGFSVLAEQCDEGHALALDRIEIRDRREVAQARISELTEQAMQDILDSIGL